MKKLFYFLSVFLAVAAVNSCRPEQEVKEEEKMVFSDVPVNIGEEGEGDTKSLVSVDVEEFQKAALFAFKSSDKKIILKNGAPVVLETTSKSFTWSLPVNTAMDIYVIVNYGNLDLSSYIGKTTLTESELDALKFTCASQAEFKKLETEGKGLPMAGVKRSISITGQNTGLGLKVKKLFAKYNFYFDASDFTSKGYMVNSLYISSSKANTEVPFFVEGFAQTNLSKLNVVDLGTPDDIANLNYGDKAHAITLYFLENCQGNKSGCSNWWEVASSGLSGLNLCSYIDLGIKTTDPNGNDANFFYWIYLGDDCTTNFDVNRNELRTIKLRLRTPDVAPPTLGIKFIDEKNTYSYTGSTSYKDFQLRLETNIAEDDLSFSVEPEGYIGPQYVTVQGKMYPVSYIQNYYENNDKYKSTEYPHRFNFKCRMANDRTAKLRIGKMVGNSWVVFDERELSVSSAGAVTRRVKRLQLANNSLKVGNTTTGTVYSIQWKDGAQYGNEYSESSYSFNWSSDKPGVASVDASGKITAEGVGSATITATVKEGNYDYGYRSASATVNVTAADPVITYGYEIKVTPNPASVQVGKTVNLTASCEKITYSDGVETARVNHVVSSYTWTSSATGKATVNSNGVVTGVAEGNSTITAKATISGTQYSGSAVVNVTAAPADVYTIELSPDNQNIFVGGSTLTLTATVKKNGSTVTIASGDVAWSSSATSKATVSGNGATGTVTPVAAQDGVKITANYKNGTAVGEATVNVKANGVVDTEYQDLTVTISASPTTIAAAGGNSTLTASVSYKTRDKYANGTYSSWTTVTSGVPKISGGANWITQLSNEAAKTKTVTAQKQANTGAQRKATYTASFTIGSLSKSASCEITQTKSEASSTEYQNISVTLTATPSSIAASGGSSTLSASGTWQERIKYTNGDYGSWTSKSTTNFSDFTISGSATGFTRSGANVTVAANNGAARSVTYTASITKGSLTGSGSATINQAANNYNDGFEWADTEITLDSGGSKTVNFYCSQQLSPTSQYNGGVVGKLSVKYNSVTETGNSSGWKFKGTATITADANSGGTTGTVTGTCAGKNDQLNVKIPKKILSMVIEGPSSYTGQLQTTYVAYVYFNDGSVVSSQDDYQTFYWQGQGHIDYLCQEGPHNGDCTMSDGDVKLECEYYDNGFSERAIKEITWLGGGSQQPDYSYTYQSANLQIEVAGNLGGSVNDWEVAVKLLKKFNGGSQTTEYIYVQDGTVTAANLTLRVEWSYRMTSGTGGYGGWLPCTYRIPVGAEVRAELFVNNVSKGVFTSQ